MDDGDLMVGTNTTGRAKSVNAARGLVIDNLEHRGCFSHQAGAPCSTHRPGPSMRLTFSLTCDSGNEVVSPAAHAPHAQPSRRVLLTNICWPITLSAPPPAGHADTMPQPSGHARVIR